MSEMPVITTRSCGICPVSHHLASAKATDDVLQVEIPPAAKMLRELMHMGQIIHSHALHVFYLAAPDFLFSPSSDPALRNIVGIVEKHPQLAKKAIRLRQVGQDIIERVGGRPIHPVTAIPGGMSQPLTHKARYAMSKDVAEAIELAKLGIQVIEGVNEKYSFIIPNFAVFKSKYMGLVKEGNLELYDGTLKMISPEGKLLEEFDPREYLKYIGEHTEDWSYLKFPYYLKEGYPDGTYRVGPLARLNVADSISTPLANQELKKFKEMGHNGPVHETLYYHYARTIELLYAAERAKQLLDDDTIVSKDVRVPVERASGEGVGVIEAPRGTLIHHYWVDDSGIIERVNMIVSTIHNNPAMDKSVNMVAKEFVKGGKIKEGALNMVEMAVRSYDPCLSCATHAIGKMPLELELISSTGEIVDRITRDTRGDVKIG